jgi:hypothetical protein
VKKTFILSLFWLASLGSYSFADNSDINNLNTSDNFSYDAHIRPAPPVREGSVLLGQMHMAYIGHRSQMSVNSCRQGIGQISAIQFQVLNANATIKSVLVQFGDGEWQQIYLGRQSFNRNLATGWLDLPGRNQCVRSIVIDGSTPWREFPRMATVRVWGRYGY